MFVSIVTRHSANVYETYENYQTVEMTFFSSDLRTRSLLAAPWTPRLRPPPRHRKTRQSKSHARLLFQGEKLLRKNARRN